MPPGGFLGRHLDAECHPIRPWKRTHSIVLGVNSAWGELCGGELVIEPDTIIGVEPGRAVIFETAGTWHQVNRVNTDVSRLYRKTLALFAWQIDHNCDGGTSAKFQRS
jgi:Rps23 Pro-64 3,4-dihydroxylase Tpa1-like proline 4-hydroxylase